MLAQDIKPAPLQFQEQHPSAPHPAMRPERRAADHSSSSGPEPRRISKPSRQAAILRDATREFSLLRRPEQAEIIRYKELFYQLIDRLEKSERRLISAMLARSAFTPRPVGLYFAQDALEVAAPFLLFSPVLNDLDLRAIAQKKGQLYANVIAKRKLPMEPFTAQSMERIDTNEVDVSSRGKPGAVVPKTSKPSEQSSADMLRDEILSLAAKGGKAGRSKVQAVEPNDMVDHGSEETAQSQTGSPPNPGDFRLPKRAVRELLAHARQGRLEELAERIEAWCGLAAADTLMLLKASRSDEPLYLIRALGIPSPHDIQLAMLIQPAIGRSIESYRQSKKTLAELNQGICQIIFNEVGARFDVPRPVGEPAFSKPAMTGFNEAARERREALRTRYEGDERFAGGLSDRWPGSGATRIDPASPVPIPMAS